MMLAFRTGDEVRLQWSYLDPKFTEYKEIVKGLRVRFWNKDKKVWVIPYDVDLLDELDRQVGNIRYDPALWVQYQQDKKSRDAALESKTRGDGDLRGYVPITEPWPHQRAAFAAAYDLPGYALFWEMGTGKTKVPIDLAIAQGMKHVLVIAPNEIIYNWFDEVQTHGGEKAVVLDGTVASRRAKFEWPMPRFVVHNAESLPHIVDTLRRPWDMIVVDEATTFKNPSAERTKALMSLAPFANKRIVMTGTPVTQHVYDVYAPMEFLKPGIFGRYGYFKWRYFELVWDKVLRKEVLRPRADTLPELLRILDTMSYRVTKKEVLPWLPEKLPPQRRMVELHGDQLAAYRQMDRAYRVYLKTLVGDIQTHAVQVVTQLLRLSEIASGFVRDEKSDRIHWFPDHAKGHVTDGLVEELVTDGKKVVIFAVWRPEIEHYADRYAQYGSAVLYGGMQPTDRQAIVRAFQSEDEPRVLVCQIGSAGRGINLTAASTAIYTSRDYSLEHWLQSQDRLHRAGQKEEVNLVTVMGKDTADLHVEAILSGKATLAEIVNKDKER